VIGLLVAAAFAAGVVDAIAGGGGLITVPALLASGLDPRVALATNKGQAIFGSSASFVSFARHGHVDRKRAPVSFLAAGLGSLVGARLVLLLSPDILRPVAVVMLLVAAGASLAKRPGHHEPSAWVKAAPRFATAAVALFFGTYDGFFGPGTGTFLLLSYAYFFGDELVSASGNAKVANFASNIAAFVTFLVAGAIRWDIALPMGVAQLAGALVGTALAVRKGAGIVRGVAVCVSLALALRIGFQLIAAWRAAS
jgi:uncharacterized membrane protein YfcA